MATSAEIARFRLMIGDTSLSDETLDMLLDDNDLNYTSAGYEYWLGVAGSYAHLASMSENGSDRKLSDLHTHALKQAEFFKKTLDEQRVAGQSTTRPIVRP